MFVGRNSISILNNIKIVITKINSYKSVQKLIIQQHIVRWLCYVAVEW